MRFSILVADDEKNIREGLAESLEMEDYQVYTAENGVEAWKLYQKGGIDLVITDLRMPGMDGEALLKKIDSDSSGVPVIILTGHGTVENAVDAMRSGAYDFLTKPLDLDRLSLLVKRALKERMLVLKQTQLEEEIEHQKTFKPFIGNSAAMMRVMDTINRVAPTKASVLIQGESGVGKELVADAIHALSPRKDKPLVKVHCAAFAESLLESELFGHEKGAFTGAQGRRRGRFEMAHEGTLFLDEIGEIDQNVQIKLLRVLQEHKFERIGGEETLDVDIRLVTATNKDLLAEIAKGSFREDLYYRLNVVSVFVPPLRERKEDIPFLIHAFLKKFAEENHKPIEGLDEKVRARLFNYDWPGNIRELRNCIESAIVMSKGRMITEHDLPPALRHASEDSWIRIPLGSTLDDADKTVINATLAAHKGNKSKAAEALGIGRKTLHRKLEEWGIKDDDDAADASA